LQCNVSAASIESGIITIRFLIASKKIRRSDIGYKIKILQLNERIKRT